MWCAGFHASGSGFGYCSAVYDGATSTAALVKDTSAIYNASDAAKGCNGFSHTLLTPFAMPIAGTWTTNFGSTLTISATQWKSVASWGTSVHTIEAYGANWVLMQNPATDACAPRERDRDAHAVPA